METKCPQWDYRVAPCPNFKGGQGSGEFGACHGGRVSKTMCAQKAVMDFVILVRLQACKKRKHDMTTETVLE